jgi:hypothetical protein
MFHLTDCSFTKPLSRDRNIHFLNLRRSPIVSSNLLCVLFVCQTYADEPKYHRKYTLYAHPYKISNSTQYKCNDFKRDVTRQQINVFVVSTHFYCPLNYRDVVISRAFVFNKQAFSYFNKTMKSLYSSDNSKPYKLSQLPLRSRIGTCVCVDSFYMFVYLI